MQGTLAEHSPWQSRTNHRQASAVRLMGQQSKKDIQKEAKGTAYPICLGT